MLKHHAKNWHKVNADATLFVDQNVASLGVVVRDSASMFMVVRALKV